MDIARIASLTVVLCATLLSGCGGGGSDDTSGGGGTGGGGTTTPPPPTTYTIGGTATGLAGTGLVLRNNGGDSLAVSANGTFKFATALASGAAYSVTVFTQPTSPSQTCSVTSSSGTLSANVSNVAVSCTTNSYKIGGSISGLQGTGLVLQNNNGDNLTVASGASSFTFGTAIASGAAYSVTVLTQPGSPAEICAATNASGTVAAADVTTVQLSCTASSSGSNGTSTSGDLINAALKAGTINLETAIEYKMFALFRDPRLPAAYQGNDSDVTESDAFDLVWSNWSTLSNEAVNILMPFLVPPIYQGSWMSPQAATTHIQSFRPQVDLDNYPCLHPSTDANWAAKIGATFKVWYDMRIPGSDAKATVARDALEGEILKGVLTTMGMKPPLPDVAIGGCNGGDGLYDVYLVDMAAEGGTSTSLGETKPPTAPQAASHSPTFTLVNRNLPDEILKGTLAHEFTHASQWAYEVKSGNLNDYHWLKEATAQEAIDIVYHTLPYSTCKYPQVSQLEQCKAVPYFKTPDKSINDPFDELRLYGGYLFFQFLAQSNLPTLIGNTWSAAKTADELHAVDAAIPGGFEQQWPVFAKLLWNQPPVDVNSFSAWDSLTITPTPLSAGTSSTNGITDVNLQGQATASIILDGTMPHLSMHYFHLKISDQNIRSVLFENHGYATTPLPNMHVSTQAFRLAPGGIWKYEHWSQDGVFDQTRFMCMDVTDERLQELVIVMSNDSMNDIELNAVEQPRLAVSNAGCWQYAGTVSVRSTTMLSDGTEKVSVDGNVTFQRSNLAGPTLNGAGGTIFFRTLSGSLTGTRNITSTGSTEADTASGPLTAEPDGTAGALSVTAGFDFIGFGKQAEVVSAASRLASLPTHVSITFSDGSKEAHDLSGDWPWLKLPDTPQPKATVQLDGSIVGTYTDPDSGGVYTWHLTPQRQP